MHSIAEPGHTDALEFEDGKIMLGKHTSLKDVNWSNIETRFGRDPFAAKFQSCDLIAFVDWTMIPYMSEIWEPLDHRSGRAAASLARQMTLQFRELLSSMLDFRAANSTLVA